MEPESVAPAAPGVAFSLGPGKSRARRLNIHDEQEGVKKQAVVGVGAGGLELADAPEAPQALIIPAQPNTFRSDRRPTFLPPPSTDGAAEIAEGVSRFEVAAPGADSASLPGTSYGLEVRGPAKGGAAVASSATAKEGAVTAGGEGAPAVTPGAPANGEGLGGEPARRAMRPSSHGRPPGGRGAEVAETEALSSALSQLPGVASLEAYEAMPVEAFGRALLAGMGWKEGTAIGGKAEEAPPLALARRPARLGLGAQPAPLPADQVARERRRPSIPGERPAAPGGAVTPAVGRPSDATGAHPPRRGAHPGKTMEVVEGRHAGLRCEVVALEPPAAGRSARVRVRLLPGGAEVSVRVADLTELGEVRDGQEKGRSRNGDGDGAGEDRDRKGFGRDRGTDRDDFRDRRHDDRDRGERCNDRDRGGRRDDRDRSDRRDERDTVREVRRQQGLGGSEMARGSVRDDRAPALGRAEKSWVVPGIRVRVIDKALLGGAHYLRKGAVTDVKAPGLCDVRLEGDAERPPVPLHDVRQVQLETVVPKHEGARVAAVGGEHGGKAGTLLRRSARDGAAAVALDAGGVHAIPLDHVAELLDEEAWGLGDG